MGAAELYLAARVRRAESPGDSGHSRRIALIVRSDEVLPKPSTAFFADFAKMGGFGKSLTPEPPSARDQILIGLVRWATDMRRSVGSHSAVQTAQRFVRGETAVDLYD